MRFSYAVLICLGLGSAAHPGEQICPDVDVTAIAERAETRDLICDASFDMAQRLAACNIDVPFPLKITATEDLPTDCAGLFDCTTKEILIATPEHLAKIARPDRPLRFVSPELEFASVIAHEMVHAAYDRVPCPFDDCLATTEYLAYAMQIQTLPPAARASVTSGFTYDRRIARDEINALFMLMAPNKFAQKAWLHLSQRDDPCGYVGMLMEGRLHFDTPSPF